jgi:flavin reductase (DIM6/NTAB) family NADH-FMN oxidoreductase RutF
VDAGEFRRVVGHFATGVTVVTTYSGGRQHAMTANSFTSVSLDPVLVLVALDRKSRFNEAVADAGTFAVNVLAADQEDVSRWFANPARPRDDLGPWPYSSGVNGAALFDAALATLECRTYETHPGGDHTLLVGEVVAMGVARPDAEPLLFYKGVYRSMAPGPEDPRPSLADGTPE